MNKKLQVFISSTFLDLKEDREVAVESVLSAGHIPAGMELFTAGNESQWETIKRWIDASDIYMLILGGRYGSIEEKSNLSYIELEYNYAIEKKKPFFSLVMSEEFLDKRVHEKGKTILELEYPQKYQDFKNKVLTKMCKFYSDSKDIKIAIYETLKDFNDRFNLAGWVSGRELPDITLYQKEIADLKEKIMTIHTEKNELLKKIRVLTTEQQAVTNNYLQEDIEERINRILRLLRYIKAEDEYKIEWVEGEGIEEKTYSVTNDLDNFTGYYVYDKEFKTFDTISFVCVESNIELKTIMLDLRVFLTKLPLAETTYSFIIINDNVDDKEIDRIKQYFSKVKEEITKENNINISFDIWDIKKVNEIEKELLLDF